MSSTTGIQNLLVNVVRPVYVYDVTATPTQYRTLLMLSNVDTYSGNVISVLRADISDANSNMYVGTQAGNTPATLTRGCVFSVALGVSAGFAMSNVSNAVYLGYNAGNGATTACNVIAIGANANGNGTNNIAIGTGSGGGNSNILIGHGIPTTSSNLLRIGSLVYGNFATQWVGIGSPNPINDFSNKFDVSGNVHISGSLGIQRSPGERTLDVNGNFRASDGFGTLDLSGGLTYSPQGFVSLRGTLQTSFGVVTIGPLKKGIVLVSAVQVDVSDNFAARTLLATTASTALDLASNLGGGTVSIVLSGGNIRISNSAAGDSFYDWGITYLPLP